MARKSRAYTDTAIAALAVPSHGRKTYPDTDQRGLYVQVTSAGGRSFYVVTRDLNGKQIWQRIGDTAIGVEAARVKAREIIGAIKSGAERGGKESFAAVAENWLKRHVDAKGHRSAHKVRLMLNKHLLPALGGRDFVSLRRSEINNALDHVADHAGRVAADKVLAVISTICNWYASRSDDYNSPIVPGMRRTSAKEQARDRVLDNDELRAVWREAESSGSFGAYVRLLLLTAQRREKVAAMKWSDVSLDGVWTIETEDREKGNAVELVLPEAALAILKALPRLPDNPYIFPGRKRKGGSMNGFSKLKSDFDSRMLFARAEEMTPDDEPEWFARYTLHDLRRTARTLMARAGVSDRVAEQVLGHSIRGVEGIYNQHEYRQEKAHALKALASLVANILRPAGAKVTRLRASK